jgi:hypothetical protein
MIMLQSDRYLCSLSRGHEGDVGGLESLEYFLWGKLFWLRNDVAGQ